MSTFAIGDEVSLPQGHRAILRWIGRIPGRQPIEYAGVEVLGPEATRLGKHSGSYQGVQYFETSQPHTGLFVSYTQLVSANIKTPRLAPPVSPSQLSVDESHASSIAFRSPRAQSPARNPRGLQETMQGPFTTPRSPRKSSPRETIVSNGTASAASAANTISSESIDAQRKFFREAMRVANDKLAEFVADFEKQQEAVKQAYEEKLAKARRSSIIIGSPSESEVEQQRLALAAMQNKLINERTEKQEEIDNLKRELQHMRKVAGSAEDLEALVNDLARYDRELTDLRSQVNEMDNLKDELGKLRAQNARLELAARNTNSSGSSTQSQGKPAAAAESSGQQAAEIARLESMLEEKLLRESELEAMNEDLQSELEALKAKLSSQQQEENTPNNKYPSIPSAGDAEKTFTAAPKIPVPAALPEIGDESSMIVDLAAGRSDWCSLCEREGHTAENCPYE